MDVVGGIGIAIIIIVGAIITYPRMIEAYKAQREIQSKFEKYTCMWFFQKIVVAFSVLLLLFVIGLVVYLIFLLD